MKTGPQSLSATHQDLYVVHSEQEELNKSAIADENEESVSTKKKNFFLNNISLDHITSFVSKWKKLIDEPWKDNYQEDNTIYDVVQQESELPLEDIIKTVLQEKYTNTADLQLAIEESNKIFHEDYPGDFILEYNNERLGLFRLCSSESTNYEGSSYRYYPEIKSFRGLY